VRNLLSGIVIGVCAITIWAVLTKPKPRIWTRTRLRHNYARTLDPEPLYDDEYFEFAAQHNGNSDPAIWGERKVTKFTSWPSDG